MMKAPPRRGIFPGEYPAAQRSMAPVHEVLTEKPLLAGM
jgi:hypothetical protein